MNNEKQRLTDKESKNLWKKWGPYLSERQWGTVREDYSEDGSAWEDFSFFQAISKAYRWGEDGIAGISDDEQNLCFSVGLWNHKDDFIKDRLFGLTGNQGNHGEDVKEIYYYLDSTPTHSYMKFLYKYPQNKFPYQKLLEENRKRGKLDPEYEIEDTGVFDKSKYFNVYVEYAKADKEDIVIRISIQNKGNRKAKIAVLPKLWFRNFWTFTYHPYKPSLSLARPGEVEVEHKDIGKYYFYFKQGEALFTENETNHHTAYGHEKRKGFFKDGINNYVFHPEVADDVVNPKKTGTLVSVLSDIEVAANDTYVLEYRLSKNKLDNPFGDTDHHLYSRINDADEFYGELQKNITSEEHKMIQRQSYAGLLITKQFYYYDVNQWFKGDKNSTPPHNRQFGRNKDWRHLNNKDIVSMPDKWEYPWYAAWDLAFHCIPIARLDPDFAKKQLLLFLKEWYMHPNGQIPAYEWQFSDVNPPLHAWAVWRVYQIEKEDTGEGDYSFLERCFHKLMLNFTWWVNRKDSEGHNIFEGGFLGLDNIGVFDRSARLPVGGKLEQADATSWMAMYSLNMLMISIELASKNKSYEDSASKFLLHFLYIAAAISNLERKNLNLWDDEDDFFYDVINLHHGNTIPLKIRSMVGLIPLFAVETLSSDLLNKLPHLKNRLEYFLHNNPRYASLVSTDYDAKSGVRRRFSLIRGARLRKVLTKMLDETEFLSDYGIRALSKFHEDHPFKFKTDTDEFTVKYAPGESTTSMFGGNSNWRGPIWFPVNFLIIESLTKYYEYYGDDFKVEYPTGSGNMLNLQEVAERISHRLISIFTKNKDGERPVYGKKDIFQTNEDFNDKILFYEYFHGDNGTGIGASHQTGWTSLVAELIKYSYDEFAQEKKKEDLDLFEV